MVRSFFFRGSGSDICTQTEWRLTRRSADHTNGFKTKKTVTCFLLRPLLLSGQFVWGFWCKKWHSLGQGFPYMLRVERSWFRKKVRARDFSLPPNVQIGSAAHTTSYSTGTGILFREHIGRGVKLTIHLYPVPRLRMSEAIPQFPLYDFMVWTGKPLPFTFLLLIRLSLVSSFPSVVLQFYPSTTDAI